MNAYEFEFLGNENRGVLSSCRCIEYTSWHCLETYQLNLNIENLLPVFHYKKNSHGLKLHRKNSVLGNKKQKILHCIAYMITK